MTIAEVCKKYDISADTLRYYERIGLIPRVPRTPGGVRDYDEESCGWIELMKCMRKAGVGIEALIEYVALFKQGDETIEARKHILIEQRNRLEERMADIQRSLETLNMKIERYEQGLMTKERQLRRRQEEKAQADRGAGIMADDMGLSGQKTIQA
ncbi:MAG: MerR family transcriptional regulator [Enterocloster asparagiformis]|nr:MerR family transcriptional regulator [Enterocloster asparagiformis]